MELDAKYLLSDGPDFWKAFPKDKDGNVIIEETNLDSNREPMTPETKVIYDNLMAKFKELEEKEEIENSNKEGDDVWS